MKQALKALIHEMEYVLSCINADKVPFDGDDFHEALRLGKEALAQPEHEKERCVGCEACIDTACGRDECPKGWPKASQPEQEPVAWRAWFDADNSAKWLFTLWPEEEHPSFDWQPLYTTTPQRTWVGLTEEEAYELWESTDSDDDWELMKRTEAKLKEKNI